MNSESSKGNETLRNAGTILPQLQVTPGAEI
jgi:hypothetical protein